MTRQFDYFYAAVGFSIALITALVAAPSFEGIGEWPKIARLAASLAAAASVGYVFGVLGLRLFFGFLLLLAACLVAAIIGLIWHFV